VVEQADNTPKRTGAFSSELGIIKIPATLKQPFVGHPVILREHSEITDQVHVLFLIA
jgi:hypothetical protein